MGIGVILFLMERTFKTGRLINIMEKRVGRVNHWADSSYRTTLNKKIQVYIPTIAPFFFLILYIFIPPPTSSKSYTKIGRAHV